MSRVFIIGMPVALRARFEKAASAHGIDLTLVLAAPGRDGVLRLLPYAGQAKVDLEIFLGDLPDWSKACVLILPYAALPPKLDDVVDMVDDAGGEVIEPEPGEDGWPVSPRRKAPDAAFYDSLLTMLCTELFPQQEIPPCPAPSAALHAAAERHPQLVIAEGVFDRCDEVDELRHEFVVKALDSLVHILENGAGGRFDAFFNARGLIHAQSGGSLVTVEVCRGDQLVKSFKVQTHLKQGDNTSPQSAARIYYCKFYLGAVTYLGVLYVGPHPEGDKDMTRRILLPAAP
jgi:hypothetical protein